MAKAMPRGYKVAIETLFSWQKVLGKFPAYFAGFEKISAPLAKNDFQTHSYWLTNDILP